MSGVPSTAIAIAGEIGSGKTTLARALADHLHCPLVSFGAYVRERAKREFGNDSRENTQAVSEELIRSRGVGGFLRDVLAVAHWSGDGPIVIEGIRQVEALHELRRYLAPVPVALIYLAVDPIRRRERLLNRDGLAPSDQLSAERHWTEIQVPTRIRGEANLVLVPKDVSEAVTDVLRWLAGTE